MKLLIAIESCDAHAERHEAQLATWCQPIHFLPPFILAGIFTGPRLGVPDDYKSLPQKTQAICKTALSEDIDFLLKCDTDTYVHVPRLLSSGFEQYDYSGFVLSWLETPYCAGPAYWLSRKAMQLVAEADLSQFRHPSYPDAEDVTVGLVLASHGITPHHDRRYALQEDVLPDNDVITSHLSTVHGAYSTEKMYAAHRKAHPC